MKSSLVVDMDQPLGKPPSNQSSTQRAYLTLRGEIITGKIAPGQRLKVDTLKDSLDTGASPVREALSLLTSDQLVERLDQRGFRVARTSRTQFHEILDLRCNLEDLAVRQSIDRADQEWEEKLVLAHHYLARSDRQQTDEFEARHKNFHLALLTACGSPILMRFCSQLYDLNVRYRYLAGTSKSYGSRDVEAEHRAILDSVVNRNANLASELLIAHYRNTGAFLAELIEGLLPLLPVTPDVDRPSTFPARFLDRAGRCAGAFGLGEVGFECCQAGWRAGTRP